MFKSRLEKWKEFLAGVLVVFGLSLAGWATFDLYTTRPSRGSLNRFSVLFTTGEIKTFLADEIHTVGTCNILITEGKPVLYICVPHLMLPLGPAEAAAPIAPVEPLVLR